MKNIKIIIIAVAAFLLANSCSEEILDIKPTSFISDAAIWDSQGLIEQNLANIYGSLLCAYNRNGDFNIPAFSHIDLATDDGNGKVDALVQYFNTGSITASYTPFADEIWANSYGLIRKTNVFITGAETLGSDVISEATLKAYAAEARFLRAFSYFQLVKFFGGVPLIKEAQTVNDDILMARNTSSEIFQFIVEECDLAIADLLENPSSGHASKGAAMALKAKALLYYASPLNNEGNDVKRWENAAAAAKVIIDMNKYSLFTNYRNLFLKDYEGNAEVIFDRQFLFPEMVHTSQATWGMWFTSDAGTWGGFSPTQDIVDAYEMKNGQLISDPTSGYDAQNPYANRDERLSQTIVYNGSMWRGEEVGEYVGGNANTNLQVNCGYGLKKFDEEAPMGTAFYDGSYAQENNWIYFRYAEVLLNYAEAQNEVAGPDQSVYDAINKVRNRAGQPGLPAGLSKDEMRARIWNERRVELVYEEHRFYDVRRWKKGVEIFGAPIHEVVITQNGDGSFSYEYKEKEERTYLPNFDLMPIPIGEIEKNPNLAPNNPGY
ncbi:MAG: RagB/SusD family nutrient uptake outer membrane protein [Prolixibacteraceae bacterium]